LDLTVKGRRDPKTKLANYTVVDHKYRLIPIERSLPEDPSMVALLAKYHERMGNKPLDEVLADISGDLLKASEGDSLIGRFACDAVREAAQTQVALLHNGAFKGEFRSGSFTRGDLHETCPFDDEVVVMDVQGSVLRKVLETSAGRKGAPGFLQLSGIEVVREGEVLTVKVAGAPLEDKTTYRVAVNDFLAQGGQGYPWFRKVASRRKTQIMLRELLEKRFLSAKRVSPSDHGRAWRLP
jgi:2',3'-cyclic-nucleotide 2'-phosphodiesterase (5'-nucleotidase family)